MHINDVNEPISLINLSLINYNNTETAKKHVFSCSIIISEDGELKEKKKRKSKNPPLSRIVEKMLKEKREREKDRFLLEK